MQAFRITEIRFEKALQRPNERPGEMPGRFDLRGTNVN